MPQPTSYILWTNDWLLYPRRIGIYLQEKDLSSKINLLRVPVSFNEQGKLSSPPGLPKVPEGIYTFPTLCIKSQNEKPDHFIYESTSIIEYFEDVFPDRNMRGATPEQRSRVRDLISIVNDVNMWNGVWTYNSRELCKPRMPYGQFEGTSKWGEQRAHELLSRIEEWAERWAHLADQRAGSETGKWLASTMEPTVADCMLYATVGFMDYLYGVDLLAGHPLLQKWKGMWEGRESAGVASYPPELMTKMARKVVDFESSSE
jgi:glutathione S-transferase